MKKIIIGIVSVVIIVSGIICFNCIKKQNVEKKQSTNVGSIEKKNNETTNENEQKVEEKNDNANEENIKQIEEKNENTKTSSKNVNIQKKAEVSNSTNQIKKSDVNNANSNSSTNDSQNNQSNNIETSQTENKQNNTQPTSNSTTNQNSSNERVEWYKENGSIKYYDTYESCKNDEDRVAFSDTDNIISLGCSEETDENGNKKVRMYISYRK